MICFQISIFAVLETACRTASASRSSLWFAFRLVSLQYWKQHISSFVRTKSVVICFQISIFAVLETARHLTLNTARKLWFAFRLVSLQYWKQPLGWCYETVLVVICFQISIFAVLETAPKDAKTTAQGLWFAFRLVSLQYWKQRSESSLQKAIVVICFQISIFAVLETASTNPSSRTWRCDLLSD